MATDKLDMALRNAIKTTSDFCECKGIKRLTTEGIWLFSEDDRRKVWMIVVKHKTIPVSEWSVSFEEENCNFSVFEVHQRKDDNSMTALYDGSGWTDGESLVCDFVSWGDFTNEVAKSWLSQIFLGTEPEVAQKECMEAMGIKTEAEAEESEEVSSEAPSETEGTITMNDVDIVVREAEDFTAFTVPLGLKSTLYDLSEFEPIIRATGNEDLIARFERCSRRVRRIGERSEHMGRRLEGIDEYTRALWEQMREAVE